jgi:hypothetical protein
MVNGSGNRFMESNLAGGIGPRRVLTYGNEYHAQCKFLNVINLTN